MNKSESSRNVKTAVKKESESTAYKTDEMDSEKNEDEDFTLDIVDGSSKDTEENKGK